MDGWSLGQPDAVLEMPVDYKVPADGFVEYEYFEIPTNFTEDKWLQAARGAPGSPRRRPSRDRHGATAKPEPRPGGFTFAQGMDIPKGQTGGPGEQAEDPKHGQGQSLFPPPQRLGRSIGGFAPGTSRFSYDPGTAMLIRAGATIVLQMHYTTNGKGATDRTRVGLTSRSSRRQTELRARHVRQRQLKIPAGDEGLFDPAEMTTTDDVTLRPHAAAHAPAREELEVHGDLSGWPSKVILSVPKYDFNWQTEYVFASR